MSSKANEGGLGHVWILVTLLWIAETFTAGTLGSIRIWREVFLAWPLLLAFGTLMFCLARFALRARRPLVVVQFVLVAWWLAAFANAQYQLPRYHTMRFVAIAASIVAAVLLVLVIDRIVNRRRGPFVFLAAVVNAIMVFGIHETVRAYRLGESRSIVDHLRGTDGLLLVGGAIVMATLAIFAARYLAREPRGPARAGSLARLLPVVAFIVGAAAWWFDGDEEVEQVARGEGPHVIMVVIDALRPDFIGAYGATREITPNLDAFAKEAVLFERCFCPSNKTARTYGAWFLGTRGVPSGVRRSRATDLADFMREKANRNYPQIARDAGLRTGFLKAFSSSLHVVSDAFVDDAFDESFPRPGVQLSGFPIIGGCVRLWRAVTGKKTGVHFEPFASMVDRASDWLSSGGERSSFLVLHAMEPHAAV